MKHIIFNRATAPRVQVHGRSSSIGYGFSEIEHGE